MDSPPICSLISQMDLNKPILYRCNYVLRDHAALKAATTDGCLAELTYMFSIHVVEEAEAVGRRVGDAVRVFGRHIEKWTHKPSLVPFLPRSRCFDVHVETLRRKWNQTSAVLVVSCATIVGHQVVFFFITLPFMETCLFSCCFLSFYTF